MSIDRFQNKDIIVSSKVPIENVKTFSLTDASNLSSINYPLITSDLTTMGLPLMESHIYSADSLVSSNYTNLEYSLNTIDADTNIDFILKPERDVRLGVQDDGYYSICYNFVKPLTGELRIINVSADGTEVELEVANEDALLKLQSLYNRINLTPTPEDTELNLGLNFENNDIAIITDVSFYNNPRVGEDVVNVPHPIGQFPEDSNNPNNAYRFT